MNSINLQRRYVLAGLGAAMAQLAPGMSFAQGLPRMRLEWRQFKKTTQYPSFLNAIAAMRRNTNAADQGSLQYWANVHQTYCPHGASYFISWHRGYLYYFEQQLRISSGDPTLNLPYWDYYSYAAVPPEFTDPSPSNPLYMKRISANVYNALDLSPFAPSVFNFQRGAVDPFEVKIETAPHNSVHDLIGGTMSTMQSPLDPIFYLHHANIDRLTHAWALPDGKGIPYTAYPYSPTNSNVYWAGANIYAPDLSIARYQTCDPTWLGYDYSFDTLPTALPPLALTAQEGTAKPLLLPRLPSNERPPYNSFTRLPGRTISATRRSLVGISRLAFNERSFSTRLRLDPTDAAEMAAVVDSVREQKELFAKPHPATLKIVLDGISLSDIGRNGGYFYSVYLNMPAVVDSQSSRDNHFLSTIGAFQIAAASHHGSRRLEFDILDLILKQQLSDFSEISLSWIRVDGDNTPAGTMMNIDEVRLELAHDEKQVQPLETSGPPGWYR